MFQWIANFFYGLLHLFRLIFNVFKNLKRSCVKWFMRKTTNLCEMQRISYGELKGYLRVNGLEKSLRSSKLSEIQDVVKMLDTKCIDISYGVKTCRRSLIIESTRQILKAKKIKESSHHAFADFLSEAIETIWTTKALSYLVNKTRLIKYDGANPHHEKLLLDIWDGLMPGETLTDIYTRQWQTIGFQGMHPETDFRGAGLLSLECFHYFVQVYRDQARQILSHSQHPQFDYPMACVLIDMTFFCFQLLSEEKANTHFYNRFTAIRAVNRTEFASVEEWEISILNLFYDFVVAVLIDFDKFWIESHPKDILDYGKVRHLFHQSIHKRLEQPDCVFHVKVQQI